MIMVIMGAQAQAQSLLTHHTRPAVTRGQAKLLSRLPETQTLRLDVVLPLRDRAGLEKFLQEVYDPASPSYRHFLTVPEFTARFGPTQEDYETVLGFAKSYGFKVVGGSRDGMDVQIEGSVTSIQLAFNISMGIYQHPTENRQFYAPDREPTVALPFSLWHISGLDNYSIPHPMLVHRNSVPDVTPNATTGSGPSASFLGSDMRAAYYGGTALTGSGQNLGLLEYYGTDLADLTTYYTNVGQTNNVPVTVYSTDGTSTSCKEPSCDDTEQTIDMTQALGMAPGLASLVMYVGSTDTAIISSMTTHSPLPTTIGCSWGWTPADPGTLDIYFEKMASQGQNFFAASGDSSTWSASNEAWPADDDYIVSVGGTDLTTASAGGAWKSETAWVDSGGGISPDKIAIPSWQQDSGVINSSNKGSTTYRNGPDVSANANFTYYVCADQTTCTANEYGGTSFAAPLWAAYIALVNQQAKLNGASSTVGFINPTLYSIGSAGTNYAADFHDITSGTSGSYSAVVGYDLVTGWGSMNGTGLITALAGPAGPNFTISASPNTVTVVRGNTGNSTITTAAVNGFSSAITLSYSGQPNGVTVTFAPNPVASPGTGTSVATFNVSSSTTTGTYPITITGTDSTGTIVNSTSVSLTVTAPTFSISASPSSVSVVQGNTGTSTISTTAENGFSSTITLSYSGQPSGVTVTFAPNPIASPGTGTSVATFNVISGTTTGTYPITITGTDSTGTIVNSTSVSLTVTAPVTGGFTLSASPSSLTVRRGRSGSTTIASTVTGGFNSAVALSASGLPAHVTATFRPTSITGTGRSTLTFSSTSSASDGTSTITITGIGGGLTKTTTVTLTINR
jgi:kumamolisin